MEFTSFNQNNDTFLANQNRSELPNLPPGVYMLAFDKQIGLMFKKIETHYDRIIDLPSPEYDYVMKRINRFLSDEAKAIFAENQFIYKWQCMLHGSFGTGKTCIVNRVSEKIVEKGGIVIFNPDPRLLPAAFKVIDDIQPNRTTMVIFEEFDGLLDQHEGALLSLLDGEIQKTNVVYLATTNNFQKIPARLKRPGRFPTILEVKYPNNAARTHFLTMKLQPKDHHLIPEWVNLTKGLSIDELRETIVSVKCFENTLHESVSRILETRNLALHVDQLNKRGEEFRYQTSEVLDECVVEVDCDVGDDDNECSAEAG